MGNDNKTGSWWSRRGKSSKVALIILVAIVAAVPLSCGEEEADVAEDGSTTSTEATATTQTPTTEATTTTTTEQETTTTEEPESEAGQQVIAFEEPITWQDGGLELYIHAMRVNDVETRLATMDDAARKAFEGMIDERTQTILVLDVEAMNNTGHVISWYPDQGEVVAGTEQVETSLFMSGDVGDGEWQDGTSRRDDILFELRAPFEEVLELGSIRYLVDLATDAEDIFTEYGSDADVVIEW